MIKHNNSYKRPAHLKNMGKTTNILLGSLLGISIFIGVCNNKIKLTKFNEKENRITGLETKIQKDFLESLKKDSAFSKLLKDTTAFYSDSLGKIANLYNKNILETERLNKKVSELSKKIKKDNFLKGLDKKYNFLSHSYDSLKNEKDKLFAFYQKEISKNHELTNLLLEQGLSSENYGSSSFKSKRNFKVKNQNFFKNWKSLAPRLFSIGNESISYKDYAPDSMEAFAVYPETNPERVEPLKKISDGDKSANFAYPEKFLNEENCIIEVYAIDKHKNESGRRAIYKSGGIISRKEITD